MKKQTFTSQITDFSYTYNNLISCFGVNLPVKALAKFSGLPHEVVQALVLCKDIERYIDQLDFLLLKYPNITSLGFAGSGKAHLINVFDDDTMLVTYDNFDIFESIENINHKKSNL